MTLSPLLLALSLLGACESLRDRIGDNCGRSDAIIAVRDQDDHHLGGDRP